MHGFDILFVSMPFGPLFQPSIGLGLLKAQLTRSGLSSKVLYLTLRLAERIGSELYIKIADGYPTSFDLVGEWVFAHALFGRDRIDADGFVNDVLRGRHPAHRLPHPPDEEFIAAVLGLQDIVDPYLESALREVLDHCPRIVGFTSVFQQHVASLALARRLKQAAPEIFILMGGANCEGAMGAETVRQFDFVDAVVSGEGDLVIVELVRRLLEGRALDGLPGVYSRTVLPTGGRYPNAPVVRDMDGLPYPDYDDFFEQYQASRLDRRNTPRLLFESARGCWWGEKTHCTFCGLNGATMTYRSKSAGRALDELVSLVTRYRGCPVSVVDNILDMGYFKDLIPELASRELGIELFFEVKANLKKEQVRLLKEAGVTMIQPGIESFSSHVLRLMRKGVSGVQNVQLLKWCKELGVTPYWNILWGFPGEPPEEYEKMARLIPLITHLRPPVSTFVLRLDRFSPNFEYAEYLGFRNVRPYPAYHYCYPLDPASVFNLAYYFVFDYAQPQDVEAYTRPVWEEVRRWHAAHETADLFVVDKGSHLLVWDLRPVARQPLTVLTGPVRDMYIFCDRAKSMHELQQFLSEKTARPVSPGDVEALVEPLLAQGLMIAEDRAYLSLAVPLGEYSPSAKVLERLLQVVRAHGGGAAAETTIPLPGEVVAVA